VPAPDSLDVTGLDITPEQLQKALEVKVEDWQNEISGIEQWFEKIGPALPTSLRDELDALKLRLNA
jgi:phosphoenolpyruvate carboxykinase (GTP)